MEKYLVRFVFADGNAMENVFDCFSDAYSFLFVTVYVYYFDKRFDSVEVRRIDNEKV